LIFHQLYIDFTEYPFYDVVTPKAHPQRSVVKISNVILDVRGKAVILDYSLAHIYGVSTKVLNQAVKRNGNRFPPDFIFRLSESETIANRSHIVTGSGKHRDPRFRPFAFTEQGAIMAATLLNSRRAVQMSIFVVRAFVRMRTLLLSKEDLAKKLVTVEKVLTARLDIHERAIIEIIQKLIQSLQTEVPLEKSAPVRRKIGFHP